jgi:hypothetical protein
MKHIAVALDQLASHAGILGCALVESDTGMVWHHAGTLSDMELVAEAAVEFWRTQRRVAIPLEAMGELKFASFKYAHQTIALVPCDEARGLILICAAQSQGVDWSDWIRHLPHLRQTVQTYVQKNKAS